MEHKDINNKIIEVGQKVILAYDSKTLIKATVTKITTKGVRCENTDYDGVWKSSAIMVL